MFKEKLKYYRKINKYTQEQMAKYLNMTHASYNYYESGRNEPSLDTFKKICILFDVSADELLELETEKQKQSFINSFNGTFKNTNIKF